MLDQDDTHITARLELRVAGLTQSFTTRNTLAAADRTSRSTLVDGPFRQLNGAWDFMPLGEGGCKVSLALDFDLRRRVDGAVMRAGFQKLADRMVDEFCAEADRMYG